MRHHVKKRKALFHPEHCRESPAAGFPILKDRITVRRPCGEKDGEPEAHKDFWDEKGACRRIGTGTWKGQTVFLIDKSKVPNYEAMEAWATEKKGGDEVDFKKESPEAKEAWKVADAQEWAKIVQSGAVKVLTVEESEKIRQELKKSGKEGRIFADQNGSALQTLRTTGGSTGSEEPSLCSG